MAGNLGEFYIKEQDKDITLKTYLSTAFQTFDDGIKHITDKLKLNETLKPTEYDNSILKQIENLNQAWTIKDIFKVEF